MGLVIGLICAGIFLLALYMVLLYLFYGGAVMMFVTFSPVLGVLLFFLVRYFAPHSYEKMSKTVLAEAARKDAEEVTARAEAIRKNVEHKTGENNSKLKVVREQLRQTQEKIASCQVIPQYYKNAAMVSIIENYIRSGRADSVKQAINLYEKEKLTVEVIEMENRAANASSVEESKHQAFVDATSGMRDSMYAHEDKMRENEKMRQKLQAENDILTDELERGRKINKYPQ